jgi:hypothetical protein
MTKRSLVALACVLAGCGSDDPPPPGSGNPAGVGNYCQVNTDCPTGECYVGPGGGYCTSPCTNEGDIAECPVDTVCKPIQGGAPRCLLICGSASTCDTAGQPCATDFCPLGSQCVSIANTTVRACEPSPT